MNLHEVNVSKFVRLIDLKYTILPLFLNIFLDSAYTKREKYHFLKIWGRLKGDK